MKHTRYAADRFASYINWLVVAGVGYIASTYVLEPVVLGGIIVSAVLTLVSYRFCLDERSYRVGLNLCSISRWFQALALAATILSPALRSSGIWMLAAVPLFVEAYVRGSFIGSFALCAAVIGVEFESAQLQRHLLQLGELPAVSAFLATFIGYFVARHFSREAIVSKQQKRLETVLECGTDLAESCDLKATVTHTLRTAVHETRATCGYVMLLDDKQKDSLITEVAYGVDGNFDFPERMQVGSGLSGYVAKVAQPIAVVGGEKEHHNFDGINAGLRSAASIPLVVRTQTGGGQAAVDQVLGVMTVLDTNSKHTFTDENMELLRSLGSLISVAVSSAKIEERRRTTFLLTLESLATALEARDEYTRGHSQRVCEVSLMIGERLGFGPEAMEELRVGTILHDIGKIGVPDAILNKRARLTDEEFTVMKSHPVIGYEICKPLMLSEGVLMIIRNHHEKLDGSGYPDKIKGGELPLSLRVVCVADAFDAMSSRRPYRSVMETSTVLAELSKGAGTQFDPVVVEILKDLMSTDRLQNLYRQYWGDSEIKAA